MSKNKKKSGGWTPQLPGQQPQKAVKMPVLAQMERVATLKMPPLPLPAQPKIQHEVAVKMEFQQRGGWIFLPWDFMFNLEKKTTGSMFDLDPSKNKVYYEIYKNQIVDGATYSVRITRPVEKGVPGWGENDYQFEFSENQGVRKHSRAPVVVDYTIPTLEVAKTLLADADDLKEWFNEVCTEPKIEENKPVAGSFDEWNEYFRDARLLDRWGKDRDDRDRDWERS